MTVQRATGWFLTLSYLIGSPALAILEAKTGLISTRFGYPPAFLYLVAASQVTCALMLRTRSLVPWACAILTVLSVGAAWSHFRIHSPVTSIPAIAFTVIQIWYGLSVYRDNRSWSPRR